MSWSVSKRRRGRTGPLAAAVSFTRELANCTGHASTGFRGRALRLFLAEIRKRDQMKGAEQDLEGVGRPLFVYPKQIFCGCGVDHGSVPDRRASDCRRG